MTGFSEPMGLTAGLAILVGLLLLLAVFSGRFSSRTRNLIAGCGFALGVIGFSWSAWKSAISGDWLHIVFFVIVMVWCGLRMFRTYRDQSARALTPEAK